jgi:DNA end-binding protein Ku
VNIPVSLYPGSERTSLDLDLLDRRDLSPVGYRRINKNTGEEVPPEDVVRGYPLDGATYVLLEDEDLRRVAPERVRTIEIVAVVDRERIPPYFYDTPYFLEPEGRGAKGYVLLREALRATGKVAVARVVIRARERLAALVAEGPLLLLNTIRFAYELRDPKDLRLPGEGKSSGVSDRELDMARRLLEEMIEPWKPEQYKDEYREKLLEYVRRKQSAGEEREIREAPAREAVESPPGDLKGLLKKSVARAGDRRGRRGSKSA